ncbi:MAG: Hsp33 family molecular chaperone HslO [Enterobacterales bacterium]|nr:Hsp33 family molecular chaperone HslO [Enterobacterales bacterium]
MPDNIHRFIFDSFGIRGELVQLEDSVQRLLQSHQYPPAIADLLNQVAAVTILLTTTLKFEGRLTLQLQTSNKMKLLVVQANHKLGYRGIARYDKQADYNGMSFSDLTKGGQLSITIEPKKGKRYQGYVALDKDTFAACVEDYFNLSEQLKTRIWLFNNDSQSCGLLLQALPDMLSQDSFDHLVYLAETLTAEECLSIDASVLLSRLFHQEEVRDLQLDEVKFHCGCSKKKMLDSVALFPVEEIQSMIEEKGKITVKCEFCLNQFNFNALDLKRHQAIQGNKTQH